MIRLLAILVAIAAIAGPAWSSSLPLVVDSTMTNPDGTLTLSLHSVADWDAVAGKYSYTYTMKYLSSTVNPAPQMHEFSVDSNGPYPFVNAWNTGAFSNFTNPTYNPLNTYSVDWLAGVLQLGGTVQFGYWSSAAPTNVAVYATTLNGGWFGTGESIGMVPEPSSMLSLLGFMGVGVGLLRRRGK